VVDCVERHGIVLLRCDPLNDPAAFRIQEKKPGDAEIAENGKSAGTSGIIPLPNLNGEKAAMEDRGQKE
jgi:hypothetical protein